MAISKSDLSRMRSAGPKTAREIAYRQHQVRLASAIAAQDRWNAYRNAKASLDPICQQLPQMVCAELLKHRITDVESFLALRARDLFGYLELSPEQGVAILCLQETAFPHLCPLNRYIGTPYAEALEGGHSELLNRPILPQLQALLTASGISLPDDLSLKSTRDVFSVTAHDLRTRLGCSDDWIHQWCLFQEEAVAIVSPVDPDDSAAMAQYLQVDDDASTRAFLQRLILRLSTRARNVLRSQSIVTVNEFLHLTEDSILGWPHAGKGTANEILLVQRELSSQILANGGRLSECAASTVEVAFGRTPIQPFDVNEVATSLDRWFAVYVRSRRDRDFYFARMGMNGKRPCTLQEIGDALQMTRERVRQITDRCDLAVLNDEFFFAPLIDAIERLVASMDGASPVSEVVRKVLCRGRGARRLSHASPFIQTLSQMAHWQSHQLTIEDDRVLSAHFHARVQSLSEALGNLLQKYSTTSESPLWSISVKAVLSECGAQDNAAFRDALSSHADIVRRDGNTLYSTALWTARHGTIRDAADHVLKDAGRPIHYKELHEALKRIRANPRISLVRTQTVLETSEWSLLWGRDTFIHRTCVTLPHRLLKSILRWIELQFRDNLPMLTVEIVYARYSKECAAAGLPNRESLYSCLKTVQQEVADFYRCRFILPKGKHPSHMSAMRVLENAILEMAETRSLKSIVEILMNQVGLSYNRAHAAINGIPDLVRTVDGRLFHMGSLEISPSDLHPLLEYARECVRTVQPISVLKVYQRWRTECERLGIGCPRVLYALIERHSDDDLLAPGYPHLIRRSKETSAFSAGELLIRQMEDYVRSGRGPVRFSEIEERFAQQAGYEMWRNTNYLVRRQMTILKYDASSVIHQSALNWSADKQRSLERRAAQYYQTCVAKGRCVALLSELVRQARLPEVSARIPLAAPLLGNLLTNGGKFIVLGSAFDAYLPIKNPFGIRNFEDLVIEILNSRFGGSAETDAISSVLREMGIISCQLSTGMLRGARRVETDGKTFRTIDPSQR